MRTELDNIVENKKHKQITNKNGTPNKKNY